MDIAESEKDHLQLLLHAEQRKSESLRSELAQQNILLLEKESTNKKLIDKLSEVNTDKRVVETQLKRITEILEAKELEFTLKTERNKDYHRMLVRRVRETEECVKEVINNCGFFKELALNSLDSWGEALQNLKRGNDVDPIRTISSVFAMNDKHKKYLHDRLENPPSKKLIEPLSILESMHSELDRFKDLHNITHNYASILKVIRSPHLHQTQFAIEQEDNYLSQSISNFSFPSHQNKDSTFADSLKLDLEAEYKTKEQTKLIDRIRTFCDAISHIESGEETIEAFLKMQSEANVDIQEMIDHLSTKSHLQELVATANNQLAIVENKLREHKEINNELERERRAIEENISDYQIEIEEIKKKLVIKSKMVFERETELDQMKQRLELIKKRLEQTGNHDIELLKEHEVISNEIYATQQIEGNISDIQTLSIIFDREAFRVNIQNLGEDTYRLVTEGVDILRSISQAELSIAQRDKLETELTEKIKRLKDVKKSIESETKSSSSRISQLESQRDLLFIELSKATEENYIANHLENQNNYISSKINSELRSKTLQEDNIQLSLSNLEEKIEELKKLIAKNVSLRSSNHSILDENLFYTEEIKHWEKECQRMEEFLEENRKVLEDNQSQRTQLKLKVNKLRDHVLEMRNRGSIEQAELDALRQSSVNSIRINDDEEISVFTSIKENIGEHTEDLDHSDDHSVHSLSERGETYDPIETLETEEIYGDEEDGNQKIWKKDKDLSSKMMPELDYTKITAYSLLPLLILYLVLLLRSFESSLTQWN